MISESSYWKDFLLKMAKKLELRLAQKRWSERSFFAVEKEVFLGFYTIRKLIESRKISNSIANKTYQIYEFPRNEKVESLVSGNPVQEFDYNKAKKVQVTLAALCNQFIHSYYFAPVAPEGNMLIGFFICSDYKRKSGIYLITIFDVVDMYRRVGNNYPESISATRTKSEQIYSHVE